MWQVWLCERLQNRNSVNAPFQKQLEKFEPQQIMKHNSENPFEFFVSLLEIRRCVFGIVAQLKYEIFELCLENYESLWISA